MTTLSLLRAILIVLCMEGVQIAAVIIAWVVLQTALGIIAYLLFGIENERDDNK